MGLLYIVFQDLAASPTISILLITTIILALRCLYRLTFHPLAHVPGPALAKITSLWLYYHSYVGDESSAIKHLHERFGSIVQVAPNEVDISDGDAVAPIYINKGGFSKAPCYANFDFGGHETIFSTRNIEYRNVRAKSVVSLFSTKSIREGKRCIDDCADNLVQRLEKNSKLGNPVNLLGLTRSFAIDVVSTYLFRQDSKLTLGEVSSLSVSTYIDEPVAVGQFFYLPTRIFPWIEWAYEQCFPDENVATSMGLVDEYVKTLVGSCSVDSESFPKRLLALGINNEEVKVQCKDLIFAGTDSSGMNLATILRQLALHPAKHDILREEILQNRRSLDQQDIQALPYFSAVVKEALRVSMANPTRLPRLVPSPGWTFHSTYLPADTVVGCSTYQLHFDESVFPNARQFEPERWLSGRATEAMNKHWFAFGAGPRGCLARNLATTELFVATEKVVESDILRDAKVCQEEIGVFEWFNAKIKGEKIELIW